MTDPNRSCVLKVPERVTMEKLLHFDFYNLLQKVVHVGAAQPTSHVHLQMFTSVFTPRLKGRVSPDFRVLVFFYQIASSSRIRGSLVRFQILLNICGDIQI